MTPLVVGATPWARQAWKERLEHLGWLYAEDDYIKVADQHRPPYVFFFHWRKRVPVDVLMRHTCVGFHMTSLPFGRGGSPLQNLRARGVTETTMTAFRMTDEMDAGPIYLKWSLPIIGAAEEVYLRAMRCISAMAFEIVNTPMMTIPQVGVVTRLHRRTPDQSLIPDGLSLEALATHIQMLDAEGYPKAFIEARGYRFEFSRAAEYTGRIVADVTIRRVEP